MKSPFLLSSVTQVCVRSVSNLLKTLRFAIALGVLVFACVVLGCGYVSTSDYLGHIKTVTISPLEIQDPDFAYDAASGRPYDEVIRESLTERFNQKWRDGNDAQLDMTILEYDLEPLTYDANNQPEQFRMILVIEYEFKDRVRNRIIDRKDNYIQIHDFYVVEGGGEPPETREEAQARLIQELVDDFYSTLAEQW